LLCAWRELQILRQHTFWHAQWDTQALKMPEIKELLDVTLEELTEEHQQIVKGQGIKTPMLISWYRK